VYYRGGVATCQFTDFLEFEHHDDLFLLSKQQEHRLLEALCHALRQIATVHAYLANSIFKQAIELQSLYLILERSLLAPCLLEYGFAQCRALLCRSRIGHTMKFTEDPRYDAD
jgi:hypothetical protein